MLLLQCIFAQEPEFLTYESKDFGFSIQYPSDWKKEEADFYMRTEEFLGRNVTLEEFAQIQKAYISSLLAASSFNEIKTIVGNRPAWQMEYSFKGIGETIRHGLNILTLQVNTKLALKGLV
jgi:hypothetical protein